MKVNELCRVDWDEYAREYVEKKRPAYVPLYTNLEYGFFSTVIGLGGCIINGHKYEIMNPHIDIHSCGKRDWIAVECDFLKWVRSRCKNMEKVVLNDSVQEELF